MEAAKPAGKRQRIKNDAAFRTEAVHHVDQDGQAATHVVQALGMSEAVLGKSMWAAALFTQIQEELTSDYAYKYDSLRAYVLELLPLGQKRRRQSMSTQVRP